jgi:hypothetical protein
LAENDGEMDVPRRFLLKFERHLAGAAIDDEPHNHYSRVLPEFNRNR